MRGKYMSRRKFLSALEKGFGFCDVVLGWDCQDQLYDNVSYTGWHTGYPDALVRILPESVRELPFEDDTLFFLGEFAEAAEAVCPRGVLRRVLERARQSGFDALAGFEYEFFVFEEDAHSIRAKGYRDLKPMVERLVRKQRDLVSGMVRKAKSLLEAEEIDEDEASLLLYQVSQGMPKNKQFLHLLEEVKP